MKRSKAFNLTAGPDSSNLHGEVFLRFCSRTELRTISVAYVFTIGMGCERYLVRIVMYGMDPARFHADELALAGVEIMLV